MRPLRPSGEAEMVAAFSRTELSSDRFGPGIRALLERDGVPERVVTVPGFGNDVENRVRLQLLTEHRGYGTRTELFEGFPDDVCWQWMAVTPAELAEVGCVNQDWIWIWPTFRDRAGPGVSPDGVTASW